jgi:hypothetical protein
MKTSSRVLLVVAGYLLAGVIAWAVVAVYAAVTIGPDRQAYGAMFAFGDSVLLLGVFAVASLPATGAALFFLRPYPTFWRVFAVGAVAIALTGLVVLADALMSRGSTAGAVLGRWAVLSPIRTLVAPVLAMIFLLCGLLAPTRRTRLTLLATAAVELVLFASVAFIWFRG